MKKLRPLAIWIAPAVLFGWAACSAPPERPSEAKTVEIDLDAAVPIELPAFGAELAPVVFRTPDGREGWALQIPGGRPIATPAYWNGMLFVGGGYGSHEFYAFDAQSGKLVWKMQTGDDGPTAAVVEDGLVAFNTESCTVIVANAETGAVVWQEWLGDPLMSQPAIDAGRLYLAFPQSRGDGQHRMLCADLRTGKHLWETVISGDVISAPVIDDGKIYFTCFNGTSYCLNGDGSVAWKRESAGTSAPLVVGNRVIVTEKERHLEGMRQLDQKGNDFSGLLAPGDASHLKEGQGGGTAVSGQTAATLDAGVGFSTAPADAKLAEANSNLGISTVAGAWAYQGSKVAYRDGYMMNAQSRGLNCVGESGRMRWKADARGRDVGGDLQVFAPPALGAKNMYVCSAYGHLLAVRQDDGAVEFNYSTKQPMAFQPALAGGSMIAGTANGLLICLKTGDADADGWFAWGGNARHNKKD